MQMMGEEKCENNFPLESAFDLLGLLCSSVIKPQFRYVWQRVLTPELG